MVRYINLFLISDTETVTKFVKRFSYTLYNGLVSSFCTDPVQLLRNDNLSFSPSLKKYLGHSRHKRYAVADINVESKKLLKI